MKYHVSWSVIALVASFLGTAQGFAQTGLAIKTVQPTRFTIPPNVFTPISIKTIPQATCVLHAEGAVDKGPSLTLFADDEGVVRFHVRPSAESDHAEHDEIDCVAGGKITRFPVHLRPNSSPTADMPAPTEVKRSLPGSYVRPALSNEDALHLAPEELVRRGYPPRPNPDQGPNVLATWLKLVTHPSTFVPARSVAHSEIKHHPPQGASNDIIQDPATSYSGYVSLTNPTIGLYDMVQGYWWVPQIQSFESNTNTYSALWVGLQTLGASPSSLWQAGTDQDGVDYHYGPFGWWHAQYASYYAWTEFPNTNNEAPQQVVPNFTVNPNDQIYAYLDISNDPSGWPFSISGPWLIAFLENYTRGENTTISICRGQLSGGTCVASGPFNSMEALWIMERPSHCSGGEGTCVPHDLSDYGNTYMVEAQAHRTAGYWQTFDGSQSGNGSLGSLPPSCASTPIIQFQCQVSPITMWSGGSIGLGDLLSAPYEVPYDGETAVWFVWYNFH